MKNTMKRFLALFAVICVLASALSVVSFAAEDESILEDSSFEGLGENGYLDWSSGWDLYWFPPQCAGDYDAAKEDLYVPNDPAGAHSGNYYLMNDRSGWYGIAEPSVELAAGDYEMSIWVKAVEGYVRINGTVDEGPEVDGSRLHILETDGNNAQPSVDVPEGNEWVQVKFTFTITVPGTYRVRIGMNSMGQDPVEYHFDDFCVKSLSNNTPNVPTGDTTMIASAVTAMVLAGALLIVTTKSKKYF